MKAKISRSRYQTEKIADQIVVLNMKRVTVYSQLLQSEFSESMPKECYNDEVDEVARA